MIFLIIPSFRVSGYRRKKRGKINTLDKVQVLSSFSSNSLNKRRLTGYLKALSRIFKATPPSDSPKLSYVPQNPRR